MTTPVSPGQKIVLLAHLECPDATVYYVDAVLKDFNRDELAESPVDLTDEGDGIFTDDSVNMPDEPYVTATYRVFLDAAKTQLASDDYCSVTEKFVRSEGGGGADFKRNGFTEITVSKSDSVEINTSSQDTEIKVKKTNNVAIDVFDEDTEIKSDGNNVDIGVTK